MDADNWIAIIGIAATVVIACLGYLLNQKNKKIELLEAKNDLLEKSNTKLELQNLRLEITGTAVNQFFQQLPKVTGERNKESG